jgi:hypothetical protein
MEYKRNLCNFYIPYRLSIYNIYNGAIKRKKKLHNFIESMQQQILISNNCQSSIDNLISPHILINNLISDTITNYDNINDIIEYIKNVTLEELQSKDHYKINNIITKLIDSFELYIDITNDYYNAINHLNKYDIDTINIIKLIYNINTEHIFSIGYLSILITMIYDIIKNYNIKNSIITNFTKKSLINHIAILMHLFDFNMNYIFNASDLYLNKAQNKFIRYYKKKQSIDIIDIYSVDIIYIKLFVHKLSKKLYTKMFVKI